MSFKVNREVILKKVKKLEGRLTNIIERAIKVVKEQGKFNAPNDATSSFKPYYDYLNPDLEFIGGVSIHYAPKDNHDSKIPGELSISYKGNKMLLSKGERSLNPLEEDRKDFYPCVKGLYVVSYIPGEWEKEVIALSEKKVKLPKVITLDEINKSNKKEISVGDLEEIARDLSLS